MCIHILTIAMLNIVITCVYENGVIRKANRGAHTGKHSKGKKTMHVSRADYPVPLDYLLPCIPTDVGRECPANTSHC